MVGVTKGLRRSLAGIMFVYFVAGCAAIGVSSYFLTTPNKRRQIILGTGQLYVALVIGLLMIGSSFLFLLGITNQKLGSLALKIFNAFVVMILFMTLSLGAYAWFQSLNIQGSYKDRWRDWTDNTRVLFQDEDKCCGYSSANDYPALVGYCSQSLIAQKLVKGCAKSMYTFVIAYLQRIYTALFLFTCVNFVSLLGSLVMIRALQDQRRYEKSMRKMINLHNLDHDVSMSEYHFDNRDAPFSNNIRSNNHLALPQDTKRVSVIYNNPNGGY